MTGTRPKAEKVNAQYRIDQRGYQRVKIVAARRGVRPAAVIQQLINDHLFERPSALETSPPPPESDPPPPE